MDAKQRKKHENRARYRARGRGLTIVKSRTRDTGAPDYGRYRIVGAGGRIVAGNDPRYKGYGLTLADVLSHLGDAAAASIGEAA